VLDKSLFLSTFKKNGKQYEEHCGPLHEHFIMCLVEYCLFNPVFIQTRVITLVQKIYTNIHGSYNRFMPRNEKRTIWPIRLLELEL